MALLSFLQDHIALTKARRLASAGDYDEALEVLETIETDHAGVLREGIRADAARHWLAATLAASEADDGKMVSRHMARARRYSTHLTDSLFFRMDRRLRRQRVALTAAEHWVQLVERARSLRRGYFEGERPVEMVESWSGFGRRSLLVRASEAWQLDELPTLVELQRAGRPALAALLPKLLTDYPADLARRPVRLGPEFARAVLFTSSGRPDLAALPLVELPLDEPLVNFELAKVAQLLELPDVARLALAGFATHAGGHRRIRRLHTGVFMAQMAVACGDEAHALEILRGCPTELLGGRPALLYASLLLRVDEAEAAKEILARLRDRPETQRDAEALWVEAERKLA